MAIRLQEDLAYLADIWNQPFLQGASSIPIPWGWDYDTRAFIHRHYGIKMTQLPTDDDLLLLRQLSSRQTTVTLAEQLTARMPELTIQRPVFLEDESAVFEYIRSHDEANTPFVLKTPWSSSGRGLSVSQVKGQDGNYHPVPRETLLRHANATIRKMGGIMAEDWITDKRQDFAMLFKATADRIVFIGYSLFDNDPAQGDTTYRCGYLRSNDAIEETLAIEPQILHGIAHHYEAILTVLLHPLLGQTWPLGYLGIDMLTTSHGVAPCIEMNLRCTMGTVCRLWYDEHREDGIFKISPMQADGHFQACFLTAQTHNNTIQLPTE